MTAIDYFSLGHPLSRLRSHYALKARRRMFDLFMNAFQPSPADRVLDLGVTPDTSLPESNFFEQLYPYRDQLTAASIEDANGLEAQFPGVRFVRLDGQRLPFPDGHFDALFCSAVLEHVGAYESQRAFVAEALRVSRRFFFTTPNRLFPIDFHTLLPLVHWLPQPAHQRILRAIGKDFWARTENLNLLTPRQVHGLFPQCRKLDVHSLKLFGWPSNILAYGEQ
jgi:SAM-dependent methyltransferase